MVVVCTAMFREDWAFSRQLESLFSGAHVLRLVCLRCHIPLEPVVPFSVTLKTTKVNDTNIL